MNHHFLFTMTATSTFIRTFLLPAAIAYFCLYVYILPSRQLPLQSNIYFSLSLFTSHFVSFAILSQATLLFLVRWWTTFYASGFSLALFSLFFPSTWPLMEVTRENGEKNTPREKKKSLMLRANRDKSSELHLSLSHPTLWDAMCYVLMFLRRERSVPRKVKKNDTKDEWRRKITHIQSTRW